MGGVDQILGQKQSYPPKADPTPPQPPRADFDYSVDLVLKAEGGFVNHPADRGGATNFGITIDTLKDWRGREVTVDDVRMMTVNEAKQIYKARYWDRLNLEGLDRTLAHVIFDQGVNFGVRAVSTRVQHVINQVLGNKTAVDGMIGPSTRKYLEQIPPRKFLVRFIAETQDHYVRIVVNRPTQLVFLAGWINRTQKLMDYLV